jgi:hypothetical protein
MSGPIQPASGAAPSEQQPYGQQYAQPRYQQPQSYPPPAQVPTFQVTTMTHTGLLVFWFNQRRTVTGTYAQCDGALRSAQTHNVVLGWWSFLSILLMNWIAIAHNSSARKKLDHDAQQAQAYAQWWHQYIIPGHGNS